MAPNELALIDEIDSDLLKRREEYNITPQEFLFVQEYLVDFDIDRAYLATHEVETDQSLTEGRKIVNRPGVITAVSSELRAQGERLFLRKEAILARVWSEALNMAAKTSERLKALEMAARMIGSLDYEKSAHPPNINISITDPTTKKSENETDGEALSKVIDITVKPSG